MEDILENQVHHNEMQILLYYYGSQILLYSSKKD